MKLTVYHNGQFWVGVIESLVDSKFKACRYLFGAEPQHQEVLDFIIYKMIPLIETTSKTISGEQQLVRKVNPKRLARLAAKDMNFSGISTKAQEAIKAEYESRKQEQKVVSKAKKEEEKNRKREIACQKAKEKHRGR